MSKDFLAEIVARKRDAVARLVAQKNAVAWRDRALKNREGAMRHRLREALERNSPMPRVIAEFKRASPSRGVIRTDLSPADVARCYERGGACAISVLTEEEYFCGSTDDLIAVRASARLPVLRKDFIINSIQIYEAAITGADAVLLIAALMDDPTLANMRTIAEDELTLDALVEVHTPDELNRALNSGAKLIGVNNRDLRTFEVSMRTSERLIADAPRDAVIISESGLHSAEQLHHLRALGFRGFLIGETLMDAEDPEGALRNLIENCNRSPVASSRR